MKVAIFSTKYYEREYLERANAAGQHQLTYFDVPLQEQTMDMARGFDAVSIQITDRVNAKVISRLSELKVKLIDLRSAGYDNVDVEAATAFGIAVMRVPAYSPEAIAEHATAMILTLDRKTHKAYNRVRENNFSLQGLMGFNLHGKTVGVVGTGKIGTAFCNIMLGFGCKVVACDITKSEPLIEKGVKYVSFEKLLALSDIISIHCPLTPMTKYLFDAMAFSKIRRGLMLINTSRGAIVNTKDAIKALKLGQIGYLGIDVYEGEENIFFRDLSDTIINDDQIERLMSFNNVLITPHQAFFTTEALTAIADITIENFDHFEQGVVSENEVTAATPKMLLNQ
ncbi:MAG: hydroxyacid dehydrogenase [Flavobacterium sp. BFFFF1]|uniref:2-hydroxyacid dehydrogenase n=1 Tax=Flavobacterium sp. BFFFF1 TaxID=2015557 RepID=UPI000BC9946D|nr:2-hydroxyacid dehydrogenase [Flavobacterium sp. BFFFF1]OYU80693.1 MAG: hydroxyacid dehydrogenase [Flavobacterium sp. BFFFF1]